MLLSYLLLCVKDLQTRFDQVTHLGNSLDGVHISDHIILILYHIKLYHIILNYIGSHLPAQVVPLGAQCHVSPDETQPLVKIQILLFDDGDGEDGEGEHKFPKNTMTF